MSNRTLHVRHSGCGSGPAVVLLHSSGSSGRQWDALAAGLASRFRVHAVDLFGHGRSPAWAGARPMTLADEAAAVATLLTAHRRGVHLVGHSYGGAVALKLALHLAATRPGLVHSLTVYEPVLFRLLFDLLGRDAAAQQAQQTGDSVRAWLARGEPIAAGRRFVDFWSGRGAWNAVPEPQQQSIAARMPAVLAHFDALAGDDLQRTDLARLPMPMLCLAGARTVGTTRRIAEVLRFLLPLAAHDRLAGVGHMGPITHAPLVNARIAAFLDAQVSRQQAHETALAPADEQGAWQQAA